MSSQEVSLRTVLGVLQDHMYPILLFCLKVEKRPAQSRNGKLVGWQKWLANWLTIAVTWQNQLSPLCTPSGTGTRSAGNSTLWYPFAIMEQCAA